jgi:hypothetical protein
MKKENKLLLLFLYLFILSVMFVWGVKYLISSEQKIASDKIASEIQYYKIEYDPKSCNDKTNGQYIFLAIQRNVFQIEWDGESTLESFSRVRPDLQKSNPIPIDQNAPEGCFENPIQVSNFNYQRLRFFDKRGYVKSDMIQTEWERISHSTDANCKKEDEIFSSCRSFSPEPKTASDLPVMEQEAIYRADPSKYANPDGSPFIIYCPFYSGRPCQFAYTIQEGVSLHYLFTRFDPTSTHYSNSYPDAQTISSSIEIDKKIRKLVNIILVTEYPWKPKS